ncbi:MULTISPECIES: urea ABC transporter ATP-binding subunit UrtE [Hahella]|uniref:ABC-type branched-chain amino acid transport system, ATPase component n=1 Tax=Hahella chejuensis (strain KCTC 2396) TaxID=349521 RepID=Q2SDQ9_HAHCH|nr:MULTISPECIES: urea ABC transporter ATP-binding subunit UrtE [Hahella]ABC31215.1 ABC-type branched-chain amino acid transport system, ATPase component [Hahella chejuensis KCTC 2396]MDG9671953.1 urea ABC transporter ATP-binding subunit UrtE [Hahella sp. CR1]
MLNVQNVDLFYGASQALYGVSMEAEAGKVSCILGRNGVGKTSLLRALSGRHPVKKGAVLWQGRDIARLSPHDRAKLGIAYVPQGREIFSQLTVLENLKTGFAAIPRSQRSIPEEIFTLFPVLKSMLKRRGGDLSGGQQQQLAIARALVTRPKLLMLDEPTEGIQPSIIKDIQSVIGRLRDRGDMAIVLIEQYLDFAYELADNYAVLDRGSVVLSGQKADMDKEQVRGYMTV